MYQVKTIEEEKKFFRGWKRTNDVENGRIRAGRKGERGISDSCLRRVVIQTRERLQCNLVRMNYLS